MNENPDENTPARRAPAERDDAAGKPVARELAEEELDRIYGGRVPLALSGSTPVSVQVGKIDSFTIKQTVVKD